jgi:hypothetical protein
MIFMRRGEPTGSWVIPPKIVLVLVVVLVLEPQKRPTTRTIFIRRGEPSGSWVIASAMNRLTFPFPCFRQSLRDLLRQPTRPLRCPVGLSRWEGNVELLVAPSDTRTRHAWRDHEHRRTLLLSLTDDFTPPPLPADCAGILLIGHTQQRGQARGFVQLTPNQVEPIHTLRLVGAGMFTLPLTSSPLHPFTPSPLQERWSRTIGALGLDAYQRLISLRYALIGVGRTGSSLALALARLGVRHLTLIDPDPIEPHNLGEMEGVTDADLGKPKVEALADHLRAQFPNFPIFQFPIPASITHLRALHAAQASDVLFCCCDHDSARLATAAIAALFCKPLMDVATGIFQIPNPNDQTPNLNVPTNSPTHRAGTEAPPLPLTRRVMGADIRLILPAETCLLCWGGLRDETGARRALASADAERALYAQRDWRRERAGSLASLNHLAVSLALRLWEDFLSERVHTSTWVHVEFDDAGRLTVSYPLSQFPNSPIPQPPAVSAP